MRVALFVLTILVMPLCAAAQPSPREGLASALKSGDTVYLLDTASREIVGVFGKTSDSAITLMVNGEVRDFVFSEVRQITRRGRDPIWNGVLIGAAVGAAGAGGSSQRFSMAAAGAVLYGAIGAVIDYVVAARVVVYRAPSVQSVAVGPLLSNDRRGIRILVSF
jgi:hypothetical protein